MKTNFLSLFLAAALLLPFTAVAAQKTSLLDDDAAGNSNVQQGIGKDQAVQAEVQAQTQTQNQGEETIMNREAVMDREAVEAENQNQVGNEEMVTGARDDASKGQKGIRDSATGADDSVRPENSQTIGIGQAEQVQNMGASRRGRVANAVQAMLQVADRNPGIGQQIRIIAQNQNQSQEAMEAGIQKIQSRSKAMKFFFGPDYKQVRAVESKMEECDAEIEKLKQIKEQLINSADQVVVTGQIAIMEQAREELQAELSSRQKGFSLFGWLAKMLVK
ncbi:hypothetical protein KKC83_01680 [Patescibacteria group bacterium]|nr:hypothetical protein [Candidatus Falkowbacteria bacterium]MBU3905552.1 hypothetical protein [Patescibacteria group bacterium]MCG2698739.1 hypothetical protein [Candidatus Parcubacteria bacterium]MBU4015664.1 hypothetical protein [Patescibacteria group bacterium]MBU4026236.1 hypothetical protein [Patescibacteria group bacterium]